MNLAAMSLRNRTTTLVLTAVLLFGGLSSYQGLSRLEDPEFTIKDALIITTYSGASPIEVEEEVTEKVERAIQQMGELKRVESRSERGVSVVTATIKDSYGRDELPQVWDQLRRKVNDMQSELPPGTDTSVIQDDYGDVYGVYMALHGEGYSFAELKEVAQMLRREYLLVEGVAKVDLSAERTEAVYIELDRDRANQLGVTPATLEATLLDKNLAVDAGRVTVGEQFIAIDPTGTFTSTEAIGDLLIASASNDAQIYLRDVADVVRGYVEPQSELLLFDGHPAIGIGISTASGGNVVTMGEALERRTQEILGDIPLGMKLDRIAYQPTAVTSAISGFLVSLVQAVAIVIAVLLIFMGVRSGLIIGAVLCLTIAGTFIFMGPWNVALERISLGALIIALGMLVDNAIVVVDGTLVRMKRGVSAADAAIEVVGQTTVPLLGATAVAIMAFGAIGLSDDSTGEFCRSLFQVVLISLSLSWVTAVTVTPVICSLALKSTPIAEGESGPSEEAYGGMFYSLYRGLLRTTIHHRIITMTIVLLMFAASLYGFGFVKQSFFPESTRPQFMVDMWMPQGTGIEQTTRRAQEIQAYLGTLDGVGHVTAVIGAGAPRFLLTYTPEKTNSAYAQFLVDVEDARLVGTLIPEVEAHIARHWPEVSAYGKRFILGPGDGGKIQARFSGPDKDVLRELEARAMEIMHSEPSLKGIRSDWRGRTAFLEPVMAEFEANRAGIGRPDLASALRAGFEGEAIAQFREGDELLPIVVRAREADRADVQSINNLLIFSAASNEYIPLRQVVSSFDTGIRDAIVRRLNRMPTLTVHADLSFGVANDALGRIRPAIEALELPPGYTLEWWGEYKNSADGQGGILASLPFFLLAMVLIVIALFNALRQPLVIWMTVPLSLIGVSSGLLVTGQPFGFMALLGFL
ncbi:MAG: efflux RND transporter permease subunit, partial [Pseudomonadota bacterium]